MQLQEKRNEENNEIQIEEMYGSSSNDIPAFYAGSRFGSGS